MKKPKVLFVSAEQWDRDFVGEKGGHYRLAFDVSLCGPEVFQDTIEENYRNKNGFDVIVYMLGREHVTVAAYADYESNMGYLHSAHQKTFGFGCSDTGIVLCSTGPDDEILFFVQELKRQTDFKRVLAVSIPCSPKTIVAAVSHLASGKPFEVDDYLYDPPSSRPAIAPQPRKPRLYTPGAW